MELEGTATSPLLRRLNAGLVLDALRASGPMTVTDLMAQTQLSRPTVHAVADALMRLGRIRELPGDEVPGSRRGRPARRYEFRADAGYVVGVDIGAHRTGVMVADLRGDPVAERQHAFTDPHQPAAARIAAVRRTVVAALTAAGVDPADVMAMCVGAAGTVDPRDGVVKFRSGIPGFINVKLREAMEHGFGWPVVVDNDANLAAIGEQWRGVAA
ncbi:ROK family transcriptional regulator, partial [Couchioplanes caeruleus]